MNSGTAVTLTEGYFRWRCRRGMKELDFILNRYLDAQCVQMTDETKLLFDDMLAEEDMLLWYWLSGKSQPADSSLRFRTLVEQICAAG
ncbi:Succinate dehydrogenase flavin-adding protein, antitoxin of CptAB toxin-antitoxin [hydrothermal vent metagenome]|uniref:Succinate dehydrogenase flavin-adding protein, antitoxin of CptAB toxin-antitoxin n=1 Tax=hydrothermal vent metagenome TaxID=652676 RepID=A0A3B0VS05_9ZZZZ